MNDLTLTITVIAIIGSGIVAGVFYAFSTFVMKALGQMTPAAGIEAMQRINITVINPFFMLAFMGTPLISVYLAVIGFIDISEPGHSYLAAGSLLHIIGSLFVTIAFNIPRNNALAKVAPDSSEGAKVWSSYLVQWTRWNHVRTTAAAGSTVLLSLALAWGV